MKKLIIVAMMLAFVPGCAQKIDASSAESIKASIEAIKSSMNDEEKKEFEEAYTAILFPQMGNGFATAGGFASLEERVKDKLGGKTANEIIAEGNRIIAEQKNKKMEDVKVQIAELEQKESKAELAKVNLKAFNILNSHFSIEKSAIGFSRPNIELTVKNQTQHAVSRAYFQGVLSSPGRSIPWVEDSFSYTIRGGLEPGEQATWNISLDMYSGWGLAPEDRKDLILTTTVTRIDGADGEPVFDLDFTKRDKEQLEKLRKKVIELGMPTLN